MIYSVLLSARMIIYIADCCPVLPLHTQNTQQTGYFTWVSVWWSSLSPVWVRLFRNSNHVSPPVSDHTKKSDKVRLTSTERLNDEDWIKWHLHTQYSDPVMGETLLALFDNTLNVIIVQKRFQYCQDPSVAPVVHWWSCGLWIYLFFQFNWSRAWATRTTHGRREEPGKP